MTTTTATPKSGKAGKAKSRQGGLFHVYKPGQGFWTRIGTGIGAALIILFTVQFLYQNLPAWVRTDSTSIVSADQLAALRQDRTVQVLSTAPAAGGFQVKVEHLWLSPNGIWLYVVLTGVVAALGVLTWWLINRPKDAEFLIETDTEMKKVNWTTWRELIGSTKVVIFFMFFIAVMLFVYDLAFGWAFYLLDVLKIAPFGA